MRKLKYLLLILTLVLWASCSHKFDSNVLGLEFYQWNLWQDSRAEAGTDLPSCGWDDLHRGKGLLVRIPAPIEEHFSDREDTDIFWYHCRFTLPELWEDKKIFLEFEEAGPFIKVFLNEDLVGSAQGGNGGFELEVSDIIYYTRDNHLSIRISDLKGQTDGKLNGITGTILVKPGT